MNKNFKLKTFLLPFVNVFLHNNYMIWNFNQLVSSADSTKRSSCFILFHWVEFVYTVKHSCKVQHTGPITHKVIAEPISKKRKNNSNNLSRPPYSIINSVLSWFRPSMTDKSKDFIESNCTISLSGRKLLKFIKTPHTNCMKMVLLKTDVHDRILKLSRSFRLPTLW